MAGPTPAQGREAGVHGPFVRRRGRHVVSSLVVGDAAGTGAPAAVEADESGSDAHDPPGAAGSPGTLPDGTGRGPSSGRRAVQVLYVGGMPRSGSTLTDLMLHQLPGHVGVGETYYLWRNGVVHDGLCACGERFSDCAFWTEVGRLAFDGWDLALANRVMALQRAVDRTARIPLLLLPWRPRGFARDLEEYSGVLRSLYSAVSEVSGASVVVDSSKRPSLAYVLRTMPDVDLRVVHVVRDPRGVAYSFNKHVPLPPGAGMRSEMPRSSPRKVARRWVTVNGAIAALRRLGVPLTTVRYEDLVDDPRRELGKVLELSRLPATPEAWQFLSAEGVRVPSTHLFAAGRIRLVRGRMPLRRDEDWRSDLASGARRVVDVVTAASRRRYGYR